MGGEPTEVVIYTDGSCLGNPGPGGIGAVMRYKGRIKEISEGYRRTTNNRMELLAAIKALELLNRPCPVLLYTDSRYLVDAVEKKWLAGWQRKGWKRGKDEPVKNRDLWERLLPLLGKHRVRFEWVRGHAGDPDNERCDELARTAASEQPTRIDEGYAAGEPKYR